MTTKNKILVDSNIFIALANKNDSTHKKAVELFASLPPATESSICSFVYGEILTVISQRVGKEAALAHEATINSNNVEIIPVDETLLKLALEYFKKDKSKNISFTDCVSLACIDYFGFRNFLTFDEKDFKKYTRKLRFRLIG